jgi:hypothetical protein
LLTLLVGRGGFSLGDFLLPPELEGAPLLRDLIQQGAGAGRQVGAFNNSARRDVDAERASFDGGLADPGPFGPKPDRELSRDR